MTVELMLIIVAVLVVLAIIMWLLMKQTPTKQYSHRLTSVNQMARADSSQRFSYRRSPMPAPTDNDTVIFADAGDTEPAVVDIVNLALRAGHELVEAVHVRPVATQSVCVDPNRVDATGEPLPPDADETVCRVEPEAPDVDTDATTVDEAPADADQSET